MSKPLPTSFDGMIESKYLKKDDVIPDKLFTIASFEQANVAQEGQAPEYKWVMYFEEVEKGMVLNPTNIQLLKMHLDVDSPKESIGRKIVAFNDPSVSFGGKLTGGIRVRAPKGSEPKRTPPQGIDPDDVPF